MRPQKALATPVWQCWLGMKAGCGGREVWGRIHPPAPSLPHPPGPPLPPRSLLENTKLRLGLSSFPYGERCKPVQCMAGHFVHNFAASGSSSRWGNHQFSSSHLVCTRSEQQRCLPGLPPATLLLAGVRAHSGAATWAPLGTDVGVLQRGAAALPLNPGILVRSVPPHGCTPAPLSMAWQP